MGVCCGRLLLFDWRDGLFDCGAAMKTPHKHAALIKAWADGAEIEFRFIGEEWAPLNRQFWDAGENAECRAKPEPKPDTVSFAWASKHGIGIKNQTPWGGINNVKLTFDGETGKLKAAEVL